MNWKRELGGVKYDEMSDDVVLAQGGSAAKSVPTV